MKDHGVVLFHTTSSAIRAEKVLLKEGLNVKLIPTPRELSSDCGIALRFNKHEQENVKALMELFHVEFGAVHLLC